MKRANPDPPDIQRLTGLFMGSDALIVREWRAVALMWCAAFEAGKMIV
jgi:hypothetical protein